jgi:hypothetical protein
LLIALTFEAKLKKDTQMFVFSCKKLFLHQNLSNFLNIADICEVFFFFCFFVLILGACKQEQLSEKTEKDTTQNKKVASQNTEADSIEYVFQENKANLNIEQQKGIVINIVQQYCQSLNEQDFKKLQSLFADSVQFYLGQKHITKEAVAQIEKAKLKNRKNPRFFADLAKIQVFPQKAIVPIKQIEPEKNRTFEAEFVFDEAYNIIAYQERPFLERKIPLKEQWEGKFVIEGGRQIEAYLEIKNFKENTFDFFLEINPNTDCKGKYEGKASLSSDMQANSFENELCNISFELRKDGQISISERKPCRLHSPTCSFEGIYTLFGQKEFRWR